jgi:hypothetical protein
VLVLGVPVLMLVWRVPVQHSSCDCRCLSARAATAADGALGARAGAGAHAWLVNGMTVM